MNLSMPGRKLSALYLNEGSFVLLLLDHKPMDQVEHCGDSVKLYSVHTRMNRITLRPASHNFRRNHALRRQFLKPVSDAPAVFRSSCVICRLKEVRMSTTSNTYDFDNVVLERCYIG